MTELPDKCPFCDALATAWNGDVSDMFVQYSCGTLGTTANGFKRGTACLLLKQPAPSPEPFKVGDRVVCTDAPDNGGSGEILLGQQFRVDGIEWCEKTIKWKIRVGFNGYWWPADRFRLAPPEPVPPAVAPQTAWAFACKWYGSEEVAHSIAQSKKGPFSSMGADMPSDVYSPEFAEWLTLQYRLAMAKGIEIGRRPFVAQREGGETKDD